MTKMASVFVVIDGIDEAIFSAVETLPLFGKEKVTAGTRAQHLPAKGCLLIYTKAAVKPAQLVIGIYEAPVSSQKPDEGV